MRFTTFRQQNQDRLGVVTGSDVIDLQQALPNLSSDLRTNLRHGWSL